MANLIPQNPTKSQSSPIIQTSPKILEKPFKIRTTNRNNLQTPNFKILRNLRNAVEYTQRRTQQHKSSKNRVQNA